MLVGDGIATIKTVRLKQRSDPWMDNEILLAIRGLQLYVQKVLCSEGPMVRKFYVQKVFCSEGPMFRRFYVQKVLSSEGSMLRRSYVQKYLFRRSYV